LHELKIGGRIAISQRRIIGPRFFHQSINSERQCDVILLPFVALLDENEIVNVCFQQGGTTAQIANKSMKLLDEVFGERTTSKGIWPQRSTEPIPPHFVSRGLQQQRSTRTIPHALDELKLQLPVSAVNKMTGPC
jgi:hypothetical protein